MANTQINIQLSNLIEEIQRRLIGQDILRWKEEIRKKINSIEVKYNKLLEFQDLYSKEQDFYKQNGDYSDNKLFTKKGNFTKFFQSFIKNIVVENFNKQNKNITYEKLENDLYNETLSLYELLERIREELVGEQTEYRILITSGRGKNKKLLERTFTLSELIQNGFLKLQGRLNDYQMKVNIVKEDFNKLDNIELGNLNRYNEIEQLIRNNTTKKVNIGNIGQVYMYLQINNQLNSNDNNILQVYNQILSNLFSFLQGGDIGKEQVKSNIGGRATFFSVSTLLNQASILENAFQTLIHDPGLKAGIIKALTKMQVQKETLESAEKEVIDAIKTIK